MPKVCIEKHLHRVGCWASWFPAILVLGFLLIFSQPVFAKDQINWPYPDFTPSTIKDGPFKGQGTVDHIQRLIEVELNEYEHTQSIANFRRIIQMIAGGEKVCGSALLWNSERAKVVEYSVPHLLIYPVRIIIHQDMLQYFEPYKKPSGSYSLEDVLKAGKLVMGYSLGRSYAKELDKIISAHANEKNSYVTAQRAIFKGLMQMLVRKRFDFTLGYTLEIGYLMRTGAIKEEFISLSIEEADKLLEVYTGCPKNAWGRAIIDKLNPYFERIRETEEIYQGLLPWLDPKSRAEYDGAVKAYWRMKN